MRLIERSHLNYKWDDWRAFHHKEGPFVQFDTGEVICTRSSYDRDDYARRLYKDLNVEIRYTADDKMPTLYLPTGEKVAKSWLDDKGSQTILIDWTFNMAIRLGVGTGSAPQYTGKDHWQAAIPQRFRGKCVAYWAGELCRPQGSIGIKVTRPRKLTDPEREHLQSIRNYARAKWAMEHDGEAVPLPVRGELMDVDMALKMKPEDVSFNDKCRAVHNGFSKAYDVQTYQSLIVKE